MRILIITDQFPPNHFGGMAQHAYHISKFLGRRHEVAVLLPYHIDVSGNGDEGFSLVPLLSMKHPRLDAWRSARFARGFRPDVVHVCTAGMAYESLLNKYPVVVRVVGNDFLRPWVGSGLPLRSIVYRLVWGKVKRWCQNVETGRRKSEVIRQLKRADKVVANSDWTMHRLEEEGVGIESIERVVGGMDCKLFCPPTDKAAVREFLGFAPQDFVLMTAGNLIGKKGFDTVMRAVALLKKQGETQLRYIVLGDGPEEGALRQLAKAIGVDGEVKFVGRIAQACLQPITKRAISMFRSLVTTVCRADLWMSRPWVELTSRQGDAEYQSSVPGSVVCRL
ncbi:MAG: glycosyltransferase family 4 protein [Verrucomicrobiota bacterium]